MANFLVRGSRFLLTWPQSDPLSKVIIKEHLESIGETNYIIVGQESHENGGDHFHAVVLYKKRIQKRNNVFTIGEFICNVENIGRSDKDLKHCIKYTKKEGNFMEWGKEPSCMKKLDKREKAHFVLEHSNIECVESGLFNFSELCRLQQIRQLFINEWPQFQRRKVKWFYGSTGTGKTQTAWKELIDNGYALKDVFISSGKLDPFMNGYTGQRAAILDDLRAGFCRFEYLLRLLDGYPVVVNVKGGYCNWMAHDIIITAPVAPEEMYVNHQTGEPWDNLDQLLRRIDEIRFFQ